MTGGVLSDRQIRELGIITPFHEAEHRPGVISYGVTSMGYDLRLADDVRVIGGLGHYVIDPKEFDPSCTTQLDASFGAIFLPPHSSCLAHTIERVRVPRDCSALVIGKSTYARCGLIVNTTPIEPEWEGQITLELINTLNDRLCLYIDEGIAQIQFFRSSDPLGCETSYADKKGKYQGQTGVTLAKVV
jgi:dCTP deaminase